MSKKEDIEKYDERGNTIYIKRLSGFECWKKYNKNGDMTYFKNSFGKEFLYQYNEDNKIIYEKHIYGDGRNYEYWYKYDELGNQIGYKPEPVYTKFTRFEIMDI